MFLASFMGRTQIYSSQEIANREIALYIKKNEYLMSIMHHVMHHEDKELASSFLESFSRENFSRAIEIWNQFAVREFYWQPHYMACINASPCKIDSKFI